MIYDARLYNRALSQSDIARLASIVGHWQFAEGFGTSAVDSSPLANNATLSGGANWTTDCGGNYALLTNGTGGIAQTASVFSPPDVGTVAFWMRSSGVPAITTRIMGLGGDWEVRQNNDGRVISDLCGDGATTIGTTTALTEVGRWYHFAATFDSSNETYAIYVDGLLENSGTNPVAMTQQAAAVLSFGTRTGSTEYWSGALRDFRVYRRKLCPSEIAELHGLVGHWKLDELAGTTAVDSTIVGNNATYQNSPTLGMNSPVDYGVQFNGTNYAITSQSIIPPSTGTVAFWMKRDGAPTGRERFLGVGGDWEIWQDPDGLVRCDLGGNGLVGGFQTVTAMTIHNKWYHFAATFDAVAGTFAIYIDGVLDVSGSMALSSQPAAQFSIAARTGLAIERFQGSLDDVRIYNRVLCPAEIVKLHEGGDVEGVRILKWVEIQ